MVKNIVYRYSEVELKCSSSIVIHVISGMHWDCVAIYGGAVVQHTITLTSLMKMVIIANKIVEREKTQIKIGLIQTRQLTM